MDLKEFSGKGDIHLHLSSMHLYLSPEVSYEPPKLPVDIPDFKPLISELSKFGHEWKRMFYLTSEFVFLNHGALGCSLKHSLDVSHAFERYVDSEPLRAVDREMVPLMCHVIRQMSQFVHCDPRDVFLTENASSGINTILRSLSFTSQDTILTLSLGYGAVHFAVDLVCERTGAKHYKVPISLPVSGSQEIVDIVKQHLFAGVKLAIFDHIPSNAAFIMPIQELIDACRDKGIMVMIDGAHSLGQLDINIDSYGADFYVTNCHKWFANTRGSAIAHVAKKHQKSIKPLVVSWGHKRGFTAEFCWSGTQYYSQYVGLLSTLNFWKTVGGDEIRRQCRDLVMRAAKLCQEAWNVQPVCPDEMLGMMALIRLPAKLNDTNWQPSSSRNNLVADCLYFKHKIEVPIREIEDVLYVRLSCHVYNDMSDYEKLCAAVLDICDNRDSLINYNSNFKHTS